MREDNDWLDGEGFSMPEKGDKTESKVPPLASERPVKKRGSHRRNTEESYESMRRSLVMVACLSIVIAVGALLFSSYRFMQAQEMAESEAASKQTVVIATREIAPGETIGGSDLAEAAIPSAYVPVDAVALDGVSTLVGKRATVRLSPGVPVSASSVRESQAPATLASAVADGHVALSLSLDEASGVSPLLRVGDKVDIVSETDSMWSIILTDVRVLALDDEFGSALTDGYSRVTLELTPDDAVLVSAADQVRLALRPVANPEVA